ncbi:nuclease [Egbenema bharatensis]|uniref:nuclease n=1 Tax=Egbenema bharatensis TaxID=3463334 RepID=UPI003A899D42
MSKVVLLDAGPLGMLTHPRKNPEIKQWLQNLLRSGCIVKVSEIADYEVRRELLRANRFQGIQRLDLLKVTIGFVPITTEVMLTAAELWALARRQGKPTADNKALDADVILAAQALLIRQQGRETVIATTNVAHLEQFVSAQIWTTIN